MSLLITAIIVCYLLGGLVLARRANLSGSGVEFVRGVVGAVLVSTGFWLTMLLAYLVGTR